MLIDFEYAILSQVSKSISDFHMSTLYFICIQIVLLPITGDLCYSLPQDDLDKAFEMIADWTGVPVYVFKYSKSEYRWSLFQPSKHNSARSSKCRYYITILYNSQSGCFDRIVSKSGCNCLQVPPYVAPMSKG